MASSIVVEMLRNDNYEYWSGWMRNYLLALDLWDIIQDDHPNSTQPSPNNEPIADEVEYIIEDDLPNSTEPPPNNEPIADEAELKAWRKQNARALHAIQISCRPDILVKIGNPDSAKIAWDNLANLFRKPLQQEPEGKAFQSDRRANLEKLVRFEHCPWSATQRWLDRYPELTNEKISSYGQTALHMAIGAGRMHFVENLVGLMSVGGLAIQDYNGDTALHLAAVAGNTKMARHMVEKNPHLVAIANNRGFLPIVLAAANGHRDMTLYLLTKTSRQLLSEENGDHGSLLVQYLIISKMLDLAYLVLELLPGLVSAVDNAVFKRTPFSILAMSRDLFPSGCQLRFWQRWIYFWICAEPDFEVGLHDYNSYLSQSQSCESKSIAQQALGELRGLGVRFLKFLGIKQIYDLKMIHHHAWTLRHVMCVKIYKFDERFYGDFFNAVELGVVELVTKMVKFFPSLTDTVDKNGRNPIMSSIVNRQEKLFSLFLRLAGTHGHNLSVDRFGNTELHLAGMLSPSSQLDRISGPALQMQRELQWYKEVERNIHPAANYTTNQNGETPAQIFKNEHRELMIEGVKWVKDTAGSCTVVGALIITIMFAAAFTVPGGPVQDKDLGEIGSPVFLRQKAFKTFMISDAISLFTSSASVVTFLGILTSSYGELHFLESLPRKLIIGLSSLFISLATMIVAFCAALIMTLDGMAEVIIPLGLLASVPIALFMLLQAPLLAEILKSTYGPSIFDSEIRNWDDM